MWSPKSAFCSRCFFLRSNEDIWSSSPLFGLKRILRGSGPILGELISVNNVTSNGCFIWQRLLRFSFCIKICNQQRKETDVDWQKIILFRIFHFFLGYSVYTLFLNKTAFFSAFRWLKAIRSDGIKFLDVVCFTVGPDSWQNEFFRLTNGKEK